jgi:predicted Zn-dependent peptidase
MKYNTFTLANGLRIIHLPSAAPVVYCGYQIKAGSRNEDAGEEGLAHFCEHTTFKGTQRRHALEILNCLESVGGDLNAFTNKEDTTYYAAILKDHMPGPWTCSPTSSSTRLIPSRKLTRRWR